MMFVNYGGGGYWFLDHSIWHGLTIADLVMPWFMFMMGVSFTFSMKSMVKKGWTKRAMFIRILERSAKLFILGLFIVNSSDSWQTLRVPGVLQRFAICYIVVGGLQVAIRPDTNEDLGHFGDLKPYYIQWIVIGCLEVLWLSFTFALKVPGCPTGYMGPGGLHDSSKYWNCTGGAAAWIDRKFFGYNHIYDEPTSRAVYQVDQFIDGEEGNHHDPEGLLGSINSIVIVFLGLQAGKILLHFTDFKNRMIRFGAWGFVLIAIAGGLCGFEQFEGPIPINKNLWTLSFVCLMGGWGFLVLGALYAIIDHLKLWDGQPFSVVGMNSILLYLLHEILEGQIPFCGDECHFKVDSHGTRFAAQVGAITTWVLYSYYCHRRKFYLVI